MKFLLFIIVVLLFGWWFLNQEGVTLPWRSEACDTQKTATTSDDYTLTYADRFRAVRNGCF